MSGRHGMARRYRTKTKAAGLAIVLAASGLVGVVSLALAPSSSAVDPSRDVVVNGQFTSPSVASGSLDLSAGSTAITGWSVTSGSVDVVAGGSVRGIGSVSLGPSQAIDLNGTGPGSISQTFPTTAGYTYTGSFFLLSSVNATTPVTKTATFTLNSTTTAVSYNSANTNGWMQQSFSFKATGSTSTIGFASTTPGADGPLVGVVEVDQPYPVFTGPVQNVIAYQYEPGGANVNYNLVAQNRNNGGGSGFVIACDHPSGSLFPVGTTSVTCTLTEPQGPSATESLTVTVLGTSSSCSGTPLGIPSYVAAHPGDGANLANSPCAYGFYQPSKPILIPLLPSASNLKYSFGPTSIEIDNIQASTSFFHTGQAYVSSSSSASIGAVTLTVFGNTYTFQNLNSQARASLAYGNNDILDDADCSTATATGSTWVGSLVINGKTSAIDNTPYTLNLLGLVKISLNQQIKSGNTIIERALFIDLPGTASDIAIGQSIAGENCTG